MKPSRFRIREMREEDLEVAIRWATEEGWNPGRYDQAAFFAADPHGFFIAELEGEPIGTISAVRYGRSYGFIGLYVMRPDYRGTPYGGFLARRASQYLQGRIVGLDGVVAMQAGYAKAGFKLVHRNFRYQGQNIQGKRPAEIVPAAQVPFSVLSKYDQQCFGEVREEFLQAWLTQPESVALAVKSGSEIAGYGVIRACVTGYKVGPLFADSPKQAKELFISLYTAVTQSETVFLDVPEANPQALELASEFGMQRQFETARMYHGGTPAFAMEKVFGITTFELG